MSEPMFVLAKIGMRVVNPHDIYYRPGAIVGLYGKWAWVAWDEHHEEQEPSSYPISELKLFKENEAAAEVEPPSTTSCDRCGADDAKKWMGLSGLLCDDCMVWLIDDTIRDFR